MYDQDLNVHHKTYIRVGAELDSDLEALCRRCHEIESTGSSELPYAGVNDDNPTYAHRYRESCQTKETYMTEDGLAGVF